MDEIDKIVKDLLDYLNPSSKDSEDLLRRAINVANLQHQFANHEVGEAGKALAEYNPMAKSMLGKRKRLIIRLAKDDIERDLMRRVIAKRNYARKLGAALDRIHDMYLIELQRVLDA